MTELAGRIASIAQWIEDEAPYIMADQKHLDIHSQERAYWHLGYLAGLRDASAKLKASEAE